MEQKEHIIHKNDLADEARSMTAEDINNLLDLTVVYEGENAGVYKKSDTSYTTNYDDARVLGKKYVYRHSNYNGEEDQIPETALGLKEISQIPEEYYITGIKGTAYYYPVEINRTLEERSMGMDWIVEVTENMYNAIFKDTENYNLKPYFLASSGVVVDSIYAYFGPGGVNQRQCLFGLQQPLRLGLGGE